MGIALLPLSSIVQEERQIFNHLHSCRQIAFTLSCHHGPETEFFGRILNRNSVLVSERALLAMESLEKLGLSSFGEHVSSWDIYQFKRARNDTFTGVLYDGYETDSTLNLKIDQEKNL